MGYKDARNVVARETSPSRPNKKQRELAVSPEQCPDPNHTRRQKLSDDPPNKSKKQEESGMRIEHRRRHLSPDEPF